MTDLVGIFNAESRKNVSKLTGLRWFLLFEDLQNGEGPLQAIIKLGENDVCIMHVDFSGSFPDYNIFICKFKTDECFLFMKCFQLTNWRHLKIVRRQITL